MVAVLLHRSVPQGVVTSINEAQASFMERARQTATPLDDIAAQIVSMFADTFLSEVEVEYVVEEEDEVS